MLKKPKLPFKNNWFYLSLVLFAVCITLIYTSLNFLIFSERKKKEVLEEVLAIESSLHKVLVNTENLMDYISDEILRSKNRSIEEVLTIIPYLRSRIMRIPVMQTAFVWDKRNSAQIINRFGKTKSNILPPFFITFLKNNKEKVTFYTDSQMLWAVKHLKDGNRFIVLELLIEDVLDFIEVKNKLIEDIRLDSFPPPSKLSKLNYEGKLWEKIIGNLPKKEGVNYVRDTSLKQKNLIILIGMRENIKIKIFFEEYIYNIIIFLLLISAVIYSLLLLNSRLNKMIIDQCKKFSKELESNVLRFNSLEKTIESQEKVVQSITKSEVNKSSFYREIFSYHHKMHVENATSTQVVLDGLINNTFPLEGLLNLLEKIYENSYEMQCGVIKSRTEELFDLKEMINFSLSLYEGLISIKNIEVYREFGSLTYDYKSDKLLLKIFLCHIFKKSLMRLNKGGKLWVKIEKNQELIKITLSDNGYVIASKALKNWMSSESFGGYTLTEDGVFSIKKSLDIKVNEYIRDASFNVSEITFPFIELHQQKSYQKSSNIIDLSSTSQWKERGENLNVR